MAGMHDMPGMATAPPPSNGTAGGGTMHHHKMMMMHMTFFWGKNAEILFTGWPGTNNSGMYALALVFVFLLAFLAEWLSHWNNRVGSGFIQTLMHGVRVGLSYMVMLAVMSFNVGVFLAAVAGHCLGFFVFGSRVFKKPSSEKNDYSPPTNC